MWATPSKKAILPSALCAGNTTRTYGDHRDTSYIARAFLPPRAETEINKSRADFGHFNFFNRSIVITTATVVYVKARPENIHVQPLRDFRGYTRDILIKMSELSFALAASIIITHDVGRRRSALRKRFRVSLRL